MLTINIRSNKPIYEQIIDQIKELVLKEYLKEGDPIPSIRKLALATGVNPNTVSRAYQELERQNIIETIRGKGTFIASFDHMKMDLDKLAALRIQLKSIIVEMRYLQMSREEIMQEIDKIFDSTLY